MGCFVHRFLISSPNLRIDAGFSLFPPSFMHRFLISGPDLRITAGFCLGMVSPATGIEDAGGDWYHEGGIILSKKPPEWHLSPPLHEFRVRFCYSLPQRRMARLQRP